MGKCREIAPVFYSLGNHEQGLSHPNRVMLENNGITVLCDRAVQWNGITVGGLNSGYIGSTALQCEERTPNLEFLDSFSQMP